jgi:NAD(P)-dependent dehydrogenase (short-subunit alcohol dehydrogenase family)
MASVAGRLVTRPLFRSISHSTRARVSPVMAEDGQSQRRRVVVLTGASAGIGAELARQLAACAPKYGIVIAARRTAELEDVRAACEQLGAPTVSVTADVSRKADVQRVLAAALDAFGDVHVWVNNAGAGVTCPTLELEEQLVDDTLAVNLKSALWGMQCAAGHMTSRSGGGHIINVSSFLAKVPAASLRSIYSASKAALNSLSSNARMDLATSGHPDVRITTVMPGVVTTAFSSVAATRRGAFTPPAASRPPAGFASQTPSQCAAVILDVIQASAGGTGSDVQLPCEVFTQGAHQQQMALSYAQDVGAWEAGAVASALDQASTGARA